MLKVARTIPKAVIFGCAGEVLTAEEREFFADAQPWGFILFARNCREPEQIKRLIAELQEVTENAALPVLIDQEGGRVARLKPPHWREAPAAGCFAALYEQDREAAIEATRLNARLIAQELHGLGITVNCAPLADIPVPGSHDIIGDRAYGTTPEAVIPLARAMADGLLAGGVLPVLKHIPGHGRARCDSHEALPTVDSTRAELESLDFRPFKALADLPLGMTAHIRYTALDPNQPATLSPSVIRLIREEIGFGGLLMSDDLSMKALSGDLAALARQTLEAGCDLVLHCNGKMEEMRVIAEAAAPLSETASARAERAFDRLPALPEPLDVTAAEAKLSQKLHV